jgi:hypothetical protein
LYFGKNIKVLSNEPVFFVHRLAFSEKTIRFVLTEQRLVNGENTA